MIILKVTKKTGFHPLLRRCIFRKTTGVGQIDSPSRFRVIFKKFLDFRIFYFYNRINDRMKLKANNNILLDFLLHM